MGERMRDAPVYFALIQARHNPILSLGKYVPDLQERMRQAGYPDYRKTQAFAIQLDPTVEGEVALENSRRYLFLNAEATSAFLLDANAITYQTTSYQTFDNFLDEFWKGLAIVHSCVTLSFIERLGLRYLDAIVPPGGADELANYIVPGVLGLAGLLPPDIPIVHTLSETYVASDEGHLLSRTIIQDGQVRFPAGLELLGLKLASKFAEVRSVHATLDNDAFWESRFGPEEIELKRRLWKLHDRVEMAFKVATTKHAREQWK